MTLDRTDNMPQATGIPPHIDQSQKLSEVLLRVTQITLMMMNQIERVKASVVQEIKDPGWWCHFSRFSKQSVERASQTT